MSKEGITVDIEKHPADQDVFYDRNTSKDYYEDKESGKRIFLVNEFTDDIPGYYKLKHIPQDEPRIETLKYKEQPTTGFEGKLSDHSSVTVFYWKGDSQFQNPLVVKLGNGDDYYITTDSSRWDKDPSPASDLLGLLDERNCRRNKAHHIDVSTTSISYYCSSTACYAQIIVTPDTKIGTSAKYSHTMPQENDGFKVGSISHGRNRLQNIHIPSDPLRTLSVYYYSGDTSLSVPFILGFHKQPGDQRGNEYFKNNGNGWEKLFQDEGHTQEGEYSNITEKLLKIVDELTNKHFPSKAGKIAGGVFGTSFGRYGLVETYALIFNKRLSLILKLVARLIARL